MNKNNGFVEAFLVSTIIFIIFAIVSYFLYDAGAQFYIIATYIGPIIVNIALIYTTHQYIKIRNNRWLIYIAVHILFFLIIFIPLIDVLSGLWMIKKLYFSASCICIIYSIVILIRHWRRGRKG